MALHSPDILLTGFAEDIEAAAAALAGYPGKIHQAGEETTEIEEGWEGATVVYVFSIDTGYSSQMKSLFVFLHDRLTPAREVAALLTGVAPKDVIFPELEDVRAIPVSALRDHLGVE